MRKKLFTKLFNILRLSYEKEDPEVVHEQIEKGILFMGTNMWVLIFAIVVASVGLNMNSTAVVIGAMLISPLMGPINGLGYSVATYNFDLFKRSLKNLGFAVGAAVSASTLYFLITPIETAQSELLARVSPTIYDVFIALFGGFAGIVAISSKTKGNVIPGVAIATALMPPLCTAGYGLAVGQFAWFFGALYLFVINSVFIGLSALIVTHLLRYPKKTHLLKREIKNKNLVIVILLAITVLPSIYFGYVLVKREQFKIESEKFITLVRTWDNNYLLRHTINPVSREIKLIYGGSQLDSVSITELSQRAEEFGLEEVRINVEQGIRFGEIPLEKGISPDITHEIDYLRGEVILRQDKIDSLWNIKKQGEQLLSELKVLFPQVHSISVADTRRYTDSLETATSALIVLLDADTTLTYADRGRIEKWLIKRLNTEDLIIRF